MKNFDSIVENVIVSDFKVLDLGAGQGKQAENFLAKGATVTAVDQKPPLFYKQGIEYVQSDVWEFVKNLEASEKFDLIHLRNIIQFFPKAKVLTRLLPNLKGHLSENGYFAIQTFWANPNPPFDRPITSAFFLNDIMPIFEQWQIILAEEIETLANDLRGQLRTFFLTNLIIKKN